MSSVGGGKSIKSNRFSLNYDVARSRETWFCNYSDQSTIIRFRCAISQELFLSTPNWARSLLLPTMLHGKCLMKFNYSVLAICTILIWVEECCELFTLCVSDFNSIWALCLSSILSFRMSAATAAAVDYWIIGNWIFFAYFPLIEWAKAQCSTILKFHTRPSICKPSKKARNTIQPREELELTSSIASMVEMSPLLLRFWHSVETNTKSCFN